jgi:hypothetical protein
MICVAASIADIADTAAGQPVLIELAATFPRRHRHSIHENVGVFQVLRTVLPDRAAQAKETAEIELEDTRCLG